ncbi:hypothetical protein [Hwangdonia lutea]|uniref:Uncharacterized protein n=1 Tax=Hwangdonia lutea TaxID=3075823 RepID=A0AA97ELW3_9FLAO|nr:hypothetical protein [Hwangdonia sp. SCSIO 19198]WOD43552.1 hypothetical protein RNZ46_16305 [Hwangdonia sp. SCSIO 19198]
MNRFFAYLKVPFYKQSLVVSTTHENPVPKAVFFSLKSPKNNLPNLGFLNLIMVSALASGDAIILTNISLGFGIGFSNSTTLIAFVEPYVLYTAYFITKIFTAKFQNV